MKRNNFVIWATISIILLCFISCGKKADKNIPLKETQKYGSQNHLPTRQFLSFLPQPDAIALVSPSVENIINSFFKVDALRNNEIGNQLRKDPTIQFIIKEDKEKTIDNLKHLGINISKPCAFFYTLDDKWEAVLTGDNINALQKMFPNAQKSTLRTSWSWFITGKLFAYWDSNTKIGFMAHNGNTIISNDLNLITKSISGNTPPPSFHYGLNGKPVISDDEIALLISISDELKEILNNPKQPFEPSWLKAVILSLESEYDEICAFVNPEDAFFEVGVSFHARQNSPNTSLPELKLATFLSNDALLKFNLAITNGLKNVLMQLPRNDPSGQIKKSLGPAINFLNSPLFQNELAIGILPSEGKLPNIVLITMCNQIETLKSLLAIASVPDEPIGEFEVLKADLQRLAKVPIVLYIGLKNPYVIITDKKEELAKIIEKFSAPSQEEISQKLHSFCPYVFIVTNPDAIKELFNNNPDILKIDAVENLSKILPLIPEACMYNNEAWYLLKAKVNL